MIALKLQPNGQLSQLGMLCVVLLALLVRIHAIDHESLFMDELHQVSYYLNSPSEIIQLAASQQQPPLDYWIGHYISKISYSDFFVRLPAALFGTGAVALLMLIVARLTAWPLAIGAGVAMALMPFPVYFSQEARPYSIAIFFVLFVLWRLDKYLQAEKGLLRNLGIFFLALMGLLLSRTLSPLVFVVCLLAVLILFSFLMSMNKLGLAAGLKTKLPLAVLAIVAALLLYLPILLNILEKGSRYARQPTHVGVNTLYEGFSKLDLVPLWQAYITQLEPVGLILLPLLIGVPFVIGRNKRLKKDPFALSVLLLLPSASLLHLFIFQAKTDWPFRPPYPVYLLPLSIILSAICLQQVLDVIKVQWGRVHFYTVFLLSVLTLGLLGYTLLDFKTWPKRSDWKGLANYLAASYGKETLLVFDGLVPADGWEPTFYGFPRYYKGVSDRMPASLVAEYTNEIATKNYKPVLIWFYYHDYYLTRHSPYPFIPAFEKTVDYSGLFKDSSLNVKPFTGFLVVELHTSSGNGLSDMSHLLNQVLADVKPGDQVIDTLVAAAAVDKKLGLMSWKNHIATARHIMAKGREQEIFNITRYIEENL